VSSRRRLIAGLGNPGREYEWTAHNLGFLAIGRLAERAGIRVTRPESGALTGLGRIAGREVALAMPQTYMNASGGAIQELLERYEAAAEEMVVLCDDFALPWGMLRIRERGSAGGHNGLKSVIAETRTDEFLRVRMGVMPAHSVSDLAAYVLCPMSREKKEQGVRMASDAAEAVELVLAEGAGRAMSRYNRRVNFLDPAQSEE
jgi:PTH1 family peptidyl-tRNA hydrolase